MNKIVSQKCTSTTILLWQLKKGLSWEVLLCVSLHELSWQFTQLSKMCLSCLPEWLDNHKGAEVEVMQTFSKGVTLQGYLW